MIFFFDFFSRRNAPRASPRHLESVRRRSEVPGRRPAKLARPRGPRAPRSTTARPRARPPTRPQRPSRPRRRSGLVPGGPRSLPRGGAREKKNRKKSRYRPEGAHFRADLLYMKVGPVLVLWSKMVDGEVPFDVLFRSEVRFDFILEGGARLDIKVSGWGPSWF